ncbi:hypothetical protein NE237_010150 [Protea cynaroides]|uniref:Uncharacterized protein n=1 Tax=Protea cynaroides TaxID=273540 RepID=A0A9Q0KZ93_9MAGN|nr:hypothetical protein NE237_010150 [Protea cynaroides]
MVAYNDSVGDHMQHRLDFEVGSGSTVGGIISNPRVLAEEQSVDNLTSRVSDHGRLGIDSQRSQDQAMARAVQEEQSGIPMVAAGRLPSRVTNRVVPMVAIGALSRNQVRVSNMVITQDCPSDLMLLEGCVNARSAGIIEPGEDYGVFENNSLAEPGARPLKRRRKRHRWTGGRKGRRLLIKPYLDHLLLVLD